jgi:hypothetical protein
MALLYMKQASSLQQARKDLMDANAKLAALKDEKDMLLAKLVIEKKIPIKKQNSEPAADAEKKKEEGRLVEDKKAPTQPIQEKIAIEKPKPPASTPEKAETVQWAADIRQFNVSYQVAKSLLKARFRIYNVSKPKNPLSGNVVVIFKKHDDAPIKWLPVPRVRLKAGTPEGKSGQAFKINNYRTMEFKAYGLKPPIAYDTASIFVFSDDGEMILNRDFGMKIKDQPPPKTPQTDKASEKNSQIEPAAPAGDKPQAQPLNPFLQPDTQLQLPPILQNQESLPGTKDTETGIEQTPPDENSSPGEKNTSHDDPSRP